MVEPGWDPASVELDPTWGVGEAPVVTVGAGSHRELLASCPPYREIVASQLGEDAA